mmetsp:Transcript_42424/g.79626  ORF Transcript_42424/g.79626 Transcript_42424/m.79626 type:complete len:704 (-) Transcript_42424:12-2123(-)
MASPPSAPTPTIEVHGGTGIQVSWPPLLHHNPPVTRYSITVYQDGVPKYFDSKAGTLITDPSVALGVPASTTAVVMRDLPPGVYKAAVAAQNGVGWSAYSVMTVPLVLNAMNKSPAPAPAQPSVHVIDRDIRISWPAVQHNPPVTRYSITVYQDGAPKYYDSKSGTLITDPSVALGVPASTTVIVIRDLNPGVYKAAVAAQNSEGWSAYSVESTPVALTAALAPAQGPPQPSITIVNERDVRISWPPAQPDVSRYSITVYQDGVPKYYDSKSGALITDPSTAMGVPASTTVVLLRNLPPGEYKAAVAAQNSSGRWSSYSAESPSVDLQYVKPRPSLSQPIISVVNDRSIQVSWEPEQLTPEVTRYSITVYHNEVPKYYDSKSGSLITDPTAALGVPAGTASVVLKDLPPGVYKAAIAAQDSFGWSPYSQLSTPVAVKGASAPQGSSPSSGSGAPKPALTAGSSGQAPNTTADFATRLLDIDCTPKVLAPIHGVMTVPLLSIREATASLLELVPHLAMSVSVAEVFAKDLLLMKGPDPYNLTQDEISAIHLYTLPCLHANLNSVLRTADRTLAKPYFPYMRLLLTAMNKLPSFSGVLFRGVRGDLSTEYVKDREIYWWGFSSATCDGEALKHDYFLGAVGPRCLFSLNQNCGKDISRYSAYREEKEVLIPPGRKWTVMNSMEVPGAHGLRLIVLTEDPAYAALS